MGKAEGSNEVSDHVQAWGRDGGRDCKTVVQHYFCPLMEKARQAGQANESWKPENWKLKPKAGQATEKFMNFNRCEYFAPEIVHPRPQNREKSLGTRLSANSTADTTRYRVVWIF